MNWLQDAFSLKSDIRIVLIARLFVTIPLS